MKKIVLASNNAGKIKEFGALLAPFHLTVIPQAELNIPDIEETGLTFIENAILKARHASALSGLPALADDSGLAVAALNGAPGIYSARYAGKGASSHACIQKLLTAMENVPDEKRQAAFHCVLAFLNHAEDPAPLISDGLWQGSILRAPRGSAGFGYDPVFFVPSEHKTAAELTETRKGELSHRGMAVNTLLAHLSEKL
ncbi:MAG TPA: RdgB/HAM1 family non-canonical purine NTP pyrophosphatase [Gammaproteobacteria bacterium]|jgi:XTP/dITP diphosphohydrolase|nr:RdgB/HAM1 family non-canonical purine NTP pyrophosphatase [Gammaproteobacteria bacterium]